MKILIACDHGGFELKEAIKADFQNHEWVDLGCDSSDISVDYPDFGKALADKIQTADFGIVICGSGIGISIAANRNPNVRCALCTSVEMAGLARAHNDANVLSLGARLINKKLALEIVQEFLNASFEGGRHINRVKKLGDKNYE